VGPRVGLHVVATRNIPCSCRKSRIVRLNMEWSWGRQNSEVDDDDDE